MEATLLTHHLPIFPTGQVNRPRRLYQLRESTAVSLQQLLFDNDPTTSRTTGTCHGGIIPQEQEEIERCKTIVEQCLDLSA